MSAAVVSVHVERVEDTRPVDFHSGRRVMIEPACDCDCCGTGIAVLHHLSDGSVVGRECARWIERPELLPLCRPRLSKRSRAFLAARGIEPGAVTRFGHTLEEF